MPPGAVIRASVGWGLWGLGCLGGLGLKGSRPDLPQERASLVWPGRSSVMAGLGLGERGSWGGSPHRTQALVGRWRVTCPPRLSRASAGLLGFHMALGSGATGILPLTPRTRASIPG